MSQHPEVAEWLAKYPNPTSCCPKASKEQVKQWLEDDKSTIILDIRKHDFKGGNIKGALCVHYTGVYESVSDITSLCQSAGKKRIVVHCWSSKNRATKAAGWFHDEIEEKQLDDIEVFVLEGGIKGWVAGGEEYTDLMVEYEKGVIC